MMAGEISAEEYEEVIKTVVPEEARPKFKPVGKIDLDSLNKKPAPAKKEAPVEESQLLAEVRREMAEDMKTTVEEKKPVKDVHKEEVEVKPELPVVEEKQEVIVEEKNNMLYVNNNKVDFYSVSDAAKEYDYTSEDDFYNRNSGAGYIYYIIGDVVFVRFSASGDAFSDELYFVDNNGKIIKKINGENADMILSRNTGIIDSVEVRRNFLSVYFIIKN